MADGGRLSVKNEREMSRLLLLDQVDQRVREAIKCRRINSTRRKYRARDESKMRSVYECHPIKEEQTMLFGAGHSAVDARIRRDYQALTPPESPDQ